MMMNLFRRDCRPREEAVRSANVASVLSQGIKYQVLSIIIQYFPKTLFDTINRSGSGVITKKELKLFYTAFIDAVSDNLFFTPVLYSDYQFCTPVL